MKKIMSYANNASFLQPVFIAFISFSFLVTLAFSTMLNRSSDGEYIYFVP